MAARTYGGRLGVLDNQEHAGWKWKSLLFEPFELTLHWCLLSDVSTHSRASSGTLK